VGPRETNRIKKKKPSVVRHGGTHCSEFGRLRQKDQILGQPGLLSEIPSQKQEKKRGSGGRK
jgi:hypothetical protein